MNFTMSPTLRYARRLVVLVVGTTVLAIGLFLLMTPGPALIVIPIGLAILSVEFVWARHLLKRARTYFGQRENLGARAGATPAGEAEAAHNEKDGSRNQ